jgi:hypothetical protein
VQGGAIGGRGCVEGGLDGVFRDEADCSEKDVPAFLGLLGLDDDVGD